MRIFTLLLLTAISAVLLEACTENLGELLKLSPDGPAGPLYGRSWYNSHEARPGDTIIYRPQGYIIPPSTPRYGPLFLDGVRFDQYGEFTFYTFGPDDAPEAHLGHWEPLAEDKNTLAIRLENSELVPPFRLRILQIQNDRLVAVRLR